MREVGDFILERPLGSGATAQVFLATRKSNPQARVALKVFHPGVWDQNEQRKRILAEFRTVSSLRHPHIVQVHELVAPASSAQPPAVVMEYIEGGSLEEFQTRLPYILPELSVVIVRDLLEALSHAHAMGVIHRDLKPANILVRNDGRVFVSDFGLAKMRDVSKLTLSGTVLGSPDFMSPEQARGETCSPRSDLFSAAAILYFLVTGTKPFSRHTPLATLAAVTEATQEPANRRNPKISVSLAKIIDRGLSKDPSLRFASADEFKKALDEHLSACGLSDLSLTEWLQAPGDSTLTALKTMAETLTERARLEMAASADDATSATWDTVHHLSLVAPESAEIPVLLAEIEKTRRHKRMRRIAIPVVGLLALAGVASAGVWMMMNGRTNPTRRDLPPIAAAPISAMNAAVPASKLTGAEDGSLAVIPAAAAPQRASARVRVSDSLTLKAAAPKPRKQKAGRVEFSAPDSISVYWDGKKTPSRTVLESEAIGEHTLRLEKSGSQPIVRQVTVSADEPTVIQVE